jgi:tRNA pseudouridine38-40 synthase
MVRNIKLVVAYEGTNYFGWQKQERGVTIQGLLEEALGQVCAESIILHGSGRTDSGVHAAGQVANFLTHGPRTPRQIVMGVNSLLPPEIAVLSAEEVDLSFNARFSARGKHYSYDFGTGPTRDPLTIRQSWPVGPRLNWRLVENCFPVLLGEKDFAAFQSHGADVKTTVRTVTKLELSYPQPHLTRLNVYGTGFLRHMIRTMAGTLYRAGRGQLTPRDLNRILVSKNRGLAGQLAPAQGLCLRRVFYEDWPFGERSTTKS